MAREILFRGKRVDNGKWVFGGVTSCSHTVDGKTYMVSNIYFEGREDEEDFELIEVDPSTVGKLLHVEKNGRRWFEGDIAKITATLSIGETEWTSGKYIENEYTGIVQMHHRYGLCILVTAMYDLIDCEPAPFSKGLRKTIVFSRSEIIGNIHDTHLTQQS